MKILRFCKHLKTRILTERHLIEYIIIAVRKNTGNSNKVMNETLHMFALKI